MHDELAALIEAAEGRTLALFTSWRAMTAAAEAMRRTGFAGRCSPSPTCPSRRWWPASATTSTPACSPPWASGREWTCRDRRCRWWPSTGCRFPRPDDPLLQARRANLGRNAFALDRPASSGHPAGPGHRPAHPLPDRPRRGGRARLPPRHGPLPLGADPRPAPDAPNPAACGGGGVPGPLAGHPVTVALTPPPDSWRSPRRPATRRPAASRRPGRPALGPGGLRSRGAEALGAGSASRGRP